MSNRETSKIRPSDTSWIWIKAVATNPTVDDSIEARVEHAALFSDDITSEEITLQISKDQLAKNLVLGKLADLVAERGAANDLLVDLELQARRSVEVSSDAARHIQLAGLLDLIGVFTRDESLRRVIENSSFGQ